MRHPQKENFSFTSGLRLNEIKCNVLRVGSLKNKNIRYSPNKTFDWDSEQVKSLGIFFQANNRNMIKLNLLPKLEQFKNCLKQWQHRKLTLLGKVTVIKSFELPKLVYPLSVLQNPNELLIK